MSFGVVTCLVTSSIWMEVRRFILNFTTAMEVKNLEGS